MDLVNLICLHEHELFLIVENIISIVKLTMLK